MSETKNEPYVGDFDKPEMDKQIAAAWSEMSDHQRLAFVVAVDGQQAGGRVYRALERAGLQEEYMKFAMPLLEEDSGKAAAGLKTDRFPDHEEQMKELDSELSGRVENILLKGCLTNYIERGVKVGLGDVTVQLRPDGVIMNTANENGLEAHFHSSGYGEKLCNTLEVYGISDDWFNAGQRSDGVVLNFVGDNKAVEFWTAMIAMGQSYIETVNASAEK